MKMRTSISRFAHQVIVLRMAQGILVVELELLRSLGFIAGFANRRLIFIRPFILRLIVIVHGAGGGRGHGACFLKRQQLEQFRIFFVFMAHPVWC